MHDTRPASSLRLLIPIAAAALLAALLLLPAPARAQETIIPVLRVANVDGTSLKLIYSEAMDTASVPAASTYSVVVGSATGVAPSSVAVSGAKVTLTLSTGAISTDTVTVTYTKGANPLQDLASNDAANLSGRAVTNNTGGTNSQPVFSSNTTTRSVAENTMAATQFGTAVTATDVDSSDTLYYTLPSGDTNFAIGSETGQFQTFNINILDYESGTNSYIVPVYVSDRKNAAGTADTDIDDAISVTINVTNLNEAPEIVGGDQPSVPENTTAVGTYTFTDEDLNQSHTWSVESGGDGALFSITSDGVLSFRNAPNYEALGDNVAKTVSIRVTDNGSPVLSHTLAINVEVTDVNEAPVITTTGSTYETISKPEGTSTSEILATYQADDPEMDTLTWTLSGHNTDTSAFTFEGGVLKFRNVPDFESPGDNVYNLTVNVEDNFGSNIDASLPVTVTVTNAEEEGTASFTGDLSGGSTLTASVTDPDGNISSKSYQWRRSDSASSGFSAISPNGTSETYMSVDADVTKYLRVIVSYTDGEGSGKFATSDSRGPIVASNSEPTFSSMTATRTLPENSGVGVNVVGGTITATDGNGDTLTYSLIGTHASKFEVDSNGQIMTKTTGSAQNFNFENASNNSFTVTVQVHDDKDAAGDPDTTIDDTIAVTINLTNVNELPMLTSPPGALSVPENSTAVHSYAATDPDAGTVFSWSLSGADAGDFSISTSGVLTFSNAPDFENPTDSINGGGVNAYIVTVKATDNGTPPLKDQHTLTVTVTNINEAPKITSIGTTFTTFDVDENTATTTVIKTYEATDVDAGSVLTWSLEGNDAGDFVITKNTTTGNGELKFRNVPNYEAPVDANTLNDYDVTVKVSDNHGGLSDTLNVDITVNDVNETPVISGGQRRASRR